MRGCHSSMLLLYYSSEVKASSQVWQYTPGLREPKQEDGCEFKASLGDTASTLKKKIPIKQCLNAKKYQDLSLRSTRCWGEQSNFQNSSAVSYTAKVKYIHEISLFAHGKWKLWLSQKHDPIHLWWQCSWKPKHEGNTNVLEVMETWTDHDTFLQWSTTQQYKGTDCLEVPSKVSTKQKTWAHCVLWCNSIYIYILEKARL